MGASTATRVDRRIVRVPERFPGGIHGERERVARRTEWLPHSHPVHELIWSERGTLVMTAGGHAWALPPHSGLWVPAGHEHEGGMSADGEYRAAYFADDAPGMGGAPTRVEVSPLLGGLLAHLGDEALAVGPRRRAEAVVLDLLVPADEQWRMRLPDDPVVGEVARAVVEDPGADHSLDRWAAAAGVDPRTITRRFQAQLGMGFRDWVTAVRVQRAAAMLSTGALIEDIAHEVGFRSASAFGVAFRRVTGRTPRGHRDRVSVSR